MCYGKKPNKFQSTSVNLPSITLVLLGNTKVCVYNSESIVVNLHVELLQTSKSCVKYTELIPLK